MKALVNAKDRAVRSGYSLASKIMILCIASTVGALALTLALFYWQDWSADRADLAADQLKDASSLAAAASLAVETRDARAAVQVDTIFENDEVAMSARYTSLSGRRLDMARPGWRPLALAPLSDGQPQTAYRNGKLIVRVPVTAGGHRQGELVLVAVQDPIWRSLSRNTLFGLFLALASAGLSGLIARLLVNNALRPLGRLEQAMARVSETKDFSIAVEQASNDELGRLTGDFNDLLAELNAYDAHLKHAVAELTVAKDAAEEANVMKSQFLANMSHEIRTPLNGVLGMALVMAMNPLTEAQKERLEVIQKSGANLLSVLNDLLDLSKIEAGRLELEQAPFDIEEVANGAYSTFTSIANAAGVSFALIIDPEAGGRWEGDSVRVRQVLYNLISNALKFTSEGQVEVRIGAVSSEDGKRLAISVADTGIGISPEALPRLFEKFVQADNTMTRRFGGTGLGLTICRQIVELMGGMITVDSTLGEGTTVHVLLPLPWLGPTVRLPSPPAVSDVDESRELGLEGLRILAAEDNVTNQLVLKTILHSLGLEPVIVDNGQEAVDRWSQSPFDLILMDIQMPVLDGVAATREIRRREAEAGAGRTPIVALSANAMKHQVAEYLAAGMDAHLAKPIQIDRLYATLAAAPTGPGLAESASLAA
jgi:signal transduction histidine kinase/ActR/RegA family two-component response regulator